MGSMEEEKLFQMVHDFIESSSSSQESTLPVSSQPLMINQSKCFVLQEIIASNIGDLEYEVLEAVTRHGRINNIVVSSMKKKWIVMKLIKDGFNASLCQSSWPTTLGCPSGEYEYIDVVVGSSNDQNGNSMRRRQRKRRLIVDIDFKSQFELARPTPAYKELTDTLPTIFVGDEQKLKKTISLLCSAAKQSLRERDLSIPPWRTLAYMESKWLSPCSKFSPKTSFGVGGGESKEPEVLGTNGNFQKLSMWTPPIVKPKRASFGGGGSGLSSQFSNFRTKCC